MLTLTKMVQLSEEAYARLAANKKPGESFSDVVLRVAPRPHLGKLLRAIGRTKEEIDAHERWLKEMSAKDQADAERSLRRRRS